MKPNRVLVIVAHPDDAEISMSMKIEDLIKNGAEVKIHCVTRGGIKAKEYEEIRTKEALDAAALMGVKDYSFSEFPDSELEKYTTEVKKELERLIEEFKPDTIYTHFPQDNHIDHEVVSKCAQIASRSVENVFYFRSPYSVNFIPKLFYFGDQSQIEKKMEVLSIFKYAKLIDPQMIKAFCQIVPSEYLHPYLLQKLMKMSSGPVFAEMFVPERQIETI
ncbi:MAG: PIG-L family deacetylase [Candidatus Dojkabacteria bacterium]|nr:MAG: PIG-L family deacetylase [Candidatus Dojkabacteria bacterium]